MSFPAAIDFFDCLKKLFTCVQPLSCTLDETSTSTKRWFIENQKTFIVDIEEHKEHWLIVRETIPEEL